MQRTWGSVEKILYLVHRIPFPPNKGDKIRSYHLLKYLSERYEVHLGAFVDDPLDWKYGEALSEYSCSSFFCPLDARKAKIRSLRGFVQNRALSLPYYQDRRMQLWVDETLRENDINTVICFSSVMSQYVAGDAYRKLTRVSDFVDIDSDKWRQYSTKKSFPMNLVYRREAGRLLEYERSIARDFDHCLFVSRKEADLFREYAPESDERIGYFNNGVDADYFSPEKVRLNPYPGDGKRIVFTGAMDYWANVDAVSWFSREIFPRIRREVDGAEFYIVGINPSDQVLGLAECPGVHVTGAVADVRPYLAHAELVVAPLRIARGIQNKVLEAMSMSRPVVLTNAAMEGIEPTELLASRAADAPAEFAQHCVQLLKADDAGEAGRLARVFIREMYGWENSLSCIDRLLPSRGVPA